MNHPTNSIRPRLQGAALLLLLLGTAWSVLGNSLLTRPLWMDEIHSWLLVTDPDVGHAMSALADGADYNPPTYYLVARTIESFGSLTEYRLRLLSLLFAAMTTLAAYLMLSRRFSIAASMSATLLMAGHELMVLQSCEARFYALWLCLLLWYCWLLTKSVTTRRSRWLRFIALGILAASICTTHYFGVISVGLVTVVWTFRERRCRSAVMLGGGLLMISTVAVACCLPMLQGQKAALTCATWVKPPTVATSTSYLGQFFPLFPLLLCGGVAFAGWISRQQSAENLLDDRAPLPPKPAKWSEENSILLTLTLMPVVLILFSWIVQPALVNRYAIVAVAGLLPVYACLVTYGTVFIQRITVGLTTLMLAFAVHHGAATWDFNLQEHFAVQQALSDLPEDQVVVFEDRIDFWLLQHLSSVDRPQRWYLADFDSADLVRPSNLRTVQRDVGRRTEKWYPGTFPMMPVHKLVNHPEFVVVTYVDKPIGQIRYPELFESQRLNDRMYRFRLSPCGDGRK